VTKKKVTKGKYIGD